MSDEENSPAGSEGSGESEEPQFRCKKCGDGPTFTAAELDSHRARHKAEDAKRGGRKRRSGPRGNSPSRSEVTLFEEIGPPEQTPPRSSPPAKRGRGRPPGKNRSNKTYNTGVIGTWVKGTGN